MMHMTLGFNSRIKQNFGSGQWCGIKLALWGGGGGSPDL